MHTHVTVVGVRSFRASRLDAPSNYPGTAVTVVLGARDQSQRLELYFTSRQAGELFLAALEKAGSELLETQRADAEETSYVR